MKKITLVLCFLACFFCLTACGGETVKTLDPEVATTLEQTTSDLVTQFLAALDEQQAAEPRRDEQHGCPEEQHGHRIHKSE